MKNFFYNENFYSDIQALINNIHIEFNVDNAKELKEDWQIRVELADLEPIFEVDADILCELLANQNEDRLTENFGEEQDVLAALNECIDFEKLKEKLPKLYYPNGKFMSLKKSDLLCNL